MEAKNIGIAKRVEEKAGLTASMPFKPQIEGVPGVVAFARDILTQMQIRKRMIDYRLWDREQDWQHRFRS